MTSFIVLLAIVSGLSIIFLTDAMNVQRLDFGDFTFFVNVFLPEKRALYHHGHEDLLSYVGYLGTEEVFVDSGRPSYCSNHAYLVEAEWHNGLCDPSRPLRPRPRFFTPPTIFSEPDSVRVSVEQGEAEFVAENRLFDIRRTLKFAECSDNTVKVTELLQSYRGNMSPSFVHLFPGVEPSRADRKTFHIGGVQIRYSFEVPLVFEASERGIDYGAIDTCCRLRVKFPPCRVCKVAWEISDVRRK